MPHKHCIRLFRLMIGICGGPSYKPGVFLGSPQIIVIFIPYSYIHVNDFTLIIDCLCNIIVWQINVHSFVRSFVRSFVCLFVHSEYKRRT